MGVLEHINAGTGAAAGTAISPGLGTVIGAGIGFLGGGLSALSQHSANKANVQMQRETNELNAKLARENYDLQRELLQKNLDFASPLNQRQMLEEAGYNPYDYVEGAGSKPVAQTPSPQLPTMQSAMVAPEDYGIGVSKVGSELASYYATLAAARKDSADANKQEIDNQFETAIKTQELNQLGLYNEALKLDWSWKLQTQEDRVLQEHLKNEFSQAQTKTELARAAHEEIDNVTRKSFNEKQLKQLDAAINLLIEQGLTESSKRALNRAGISEIVAKVARMAMQNAVDKMVGTAQAGYYGSQAVYSSELADNVRTTTDLLKTYGNSENQLRLYSLAMDIYKGQADIKELNAMADYLQRQATYLKLRGKLDVAHTVNETASSLVDMFKKLNSPNIPLGGLMKGLLK